MSQSILAGALLTLLLLTNLIVFWAYTRHRVVAKYVNPQQEWINKNNTTRTFGDIFIWPLLDAFVSRKYYPITMGSFEVEGVDVVFSAYYNAELEEYTIKTGKYHHQLDYPAAISLSNFFFDNNPPLRLKYNRLLQLLQANKPENFDERGVLKSHVINSSSSIENVTQAHT